MAQREIDPITLEVLWSKLQQIPEEMGTHFQRTAFSDIIKYAVDFSTVLADPDGLDAITNNGVLGDGTLATRAAGRRLIDDCVAYYADEIRAEIEAH